MTGVAEIVVGEATDMVVGIQTAEQLIGVTITIIFILIVIGGIILLLLHDRDPCDYFYDDYKRFI